MGEGARAGAVTAVLCIADGWGEAPAGPGNAIRLARTPNLDRLRAASPVTTLTAHGTAVGLPEGQQGNSEVGHLTIGAGRVVPQDLTRINAAIADGSFYANPVLAEAIGQARDTGAAVHVLGLLSPGGVHSHEAHILALFELCQRLQMPRAWLHAFLDGRDTAPTSGAGHLAAALERLRSLGTGQVASVSGRYYAMDRDRRWDRTALAYRTLTEPGGPATADPVGYVEAGYARDVGDEFVTPAQVVPEGGRPVVIQPGDTVIHADFRPDRARQLTHVLVDRAFDGFDRGPRIAPLRMVTFTTYEAGLAAQVAFPKPHVQGTLGEAVAEAGLRQFHVAETEKYAHVTYFVDGGREAPWPGEERLLVPSERVATYDLAPEMRADEIAGAVVDRLERADDALLIVNFANADMVGHTGDLAATVRAVEAVDRGLGRITAAARARGAVLCFTADHGNAEVMVDRTTGGPRTAHTVSPVPLILAGDRCRGRTLRAGGGLRDVAPTLLALMGLDAPSLMTGRDLRA